MINCALQMEQINVSSEMASEAADQEQEAQKLHEAKQQNMFNQNFDKGLDEIRAAIDVIQRKITSLRQVSYK